MLTTNPFAELASAIPADIMQGYVVLMVILVIVGTILDVLHKGSAKYFFENAKKAEKSAKRTVSGGEKMSLAVQTLTSEVLTSSEFANPQRRLSHLLTMYGFILFVIATAVQIFSLPVADEASTFWPFVWHLGAAMLCVGGYWFWFFIRCDVNSEGLSWFDFRQADIFILSLLGSCSFGLLWSFTQGDTLGWIFFALFILATTTLFSTVLWSKFAHMFFKPAAAYQKKITKADGSRENLPHDYDLTAAETQSKYPDIPTYMGDNPENMGLGIKREAPNHY